MEIEISFKPSLTSFSKSIDRISLGWALQKIIRGLAKEVEGEAKKETPVDEGGLRRSIHSDDVGPLHSVVQPHVKYAFWIHEGWMWRKGKKIFIKGLGKAGTPPGGKPYMELGAKTAAQKFDVEKFIDKEIKKAFNE